MRSAISDTAPMSCVIISTAVPRLLFAQQVEDLRLHGHVQRVVGSSAISTAGSQASAMAIITRWRMPPDIWCG